MTLLIIVVFYTGPSGKFESIRFNFFISSHIPAIYDYKLGFVLLYSRANDVSTVLANNLLRKRLGKRFKKIFATLYVFTMKNEAPLSKFQTNIQ